MRYQSLRLRRHTAHSSHTHGRLAMRSKGHARGIRGSTNGLNHVSRRARKVPRRHPVRGGGGCRTPIKRSKFGGPGHTRAAERHCATITCRETARRGRALSLPRLSAPPSSALPDGAKWSAGAARVLRSAQPSRTTISEPGEVDHRPVCSDNALQNTSWRRRKGASRQLL